MDYWQSYGLIFLIACVAFVLIKALRSGRRPSKVEAAVAEEIARAEFDAQPKCVCGEIAKYPAPVLERGRGAWDWLRNYFAAPPRYSRRVDMMLPPVFCTAHAHVADAMMDQFIFAVRSRFSDLNAKVAADAAGFEQEALLKAVADSLTENQKRATRKSPATIRVLPQRTGTDDGVDSGN
jgi:hypothetical protein